MILRGQTAPPRVQPINIAAPPRVQRVTPSTATPPTNYDFPVQVTQHVSMNLPLLSTYHPTMKTFAHLRKRNLPQKFNKTKVFHQQKSVFHLENSIHLNIPTPKRSPSNTQNSILQEQANSAFLHPTINHIYREDGRKETMASLLRGPEKARWSKALSNEIGRLAQGNKYGVKATDTIEFIKKEDVPNGRAVTYASFVCDHRPLKTEQ